MPRSSIALQTALRAVVAFAAALTSCSSVTEDHLRQLTNVTVWETGSHKELLSQELWKSEKIDLDESQRELENGLLQAVSLPQTIRATKMLQTASFIPISTSMAKDLVGDLYISPQKVVDAVIERKRARISELRELRGSFPDSADKYNEWTRDEEFDIDRLTKDRQHLSPYVCRAVAFQDCGTGGFGAIFDGEGLSIDYGALGSGEFDKYNQPVVVFLPNQPHNIEFSFGVAR